MTLSEKIKKSAIPGDLFPELTTAEKKYNYVAADIAVKIRNRRKELKLTQKQFAELLGVTQGMVSKWESADYNFTIESLVELFDKLNITFALKEKPVRPNISCYKNLKSDWSSPLSLKPAAKAYNIKELEVSA